MRHYVYIESVDVFVSELVVAVTQKQKVNLTSDNTSLVVILNIAENKKDENIYNNFINATKVIKKKSKQVIDKLQSVRHFYRRLDN